MTEAARLDELLGERHRGIDPENAEPMPANVFRAGLEVTDTNGALEEHREAQHQPAAL